MAQITNTFETYDATGIREEIRDKIYLIDAKETPFLSMMSRKSIKTVTPEWQTDTLDTPSNSNTQPEGDDYTYDNISATTRLRNYAQISNKTFIISRTHDNIDKAGRNKEVTYQGAKKMVALKTDMEVGMLSNNASLAGTGNGASNRRSGGLRAWLASNDDMGGGGSSGGYNTSTNIVDAATNGSQRAFTKAIMDSVILSTYNAGGNPSICLVSPYVKTVFSSFLDDANIVALRASASPGAKRSLIASAEIYVSDFGDITVMPDRQLAREGAGSARNAYFLDMKMLELGIYREIQVDKPARTGDAHKRVVLVEYTLIVKNEAAHGVAADLYGLTAST